jgi:hypothetical protein
VQFEIDRSNAGQLDWRLVGDVRAKPAVSTTAFGSARDAHRAAAAVTVHAGSTDGSERR